MEMGELILITVAALYAAAGTYKIFGPAGGCHKCGKTVWRLGKKKLSPDKVLVWHLGCYQK